MEGKRGREKKGGSKNQAMITQERKTVFFRGVEADALNFHIQKIPHSHDL
jgi:hypothetical protein